MPSGQDVSWWSLISVALGSGLISGLVTQLVGWMIKQRDDEKQNRQLASFLAISIASSLEKFAMDCASVIQDIRNHHSSDGFIGKVGALPALAPYPDSLDWTGLERVLCSRALSFRHERELSQRTIDFCLDLAGHLEGGAGEIARQAARIGLRGWQLAADFRRHYDLPHFRTDEYEWDFIGVLEEGSKPGELKSGADLVTGC